MEYLKQTFEDQMMEHLKQTYEDQMMKHITIDVPSFDLPVFVRCSII
jgi:hypothetical protein